MATEQPYVSGDDVLEQARKLETIPRSRTATPVTAPASQKSLPAKSPRAKPFSKVSKQEVFQSVSSPDPPADYEYYDDDDPLANVSTIKTSQTGQDMLGIRSTFGTLS